jgi:ATP-dependent RNA helicase DeaD
MTADDTLPTPGFADFGLAEAVLRGVDAAGFTTPSPIQVEAIPLVLAGRDLVAQAQTGTGKTAAFGLPAISMLDPKGGADVLIVAPTRELANQISDELFRLGKFANVQTVAIYGGQSYDRQLERLARGARIVVATPGRLIDLLESGRMPGFAPKMVVLDEADEMLDMGFLEAIEKIFTFIPAERQTLLFSATMPGPIRTLAERILNNPAWVKMGVGERAAEGINQQYHVIEEHERDDAILRLVDALEPAKAIVFCRTKVEVDRLSGVLEAQGVSAKGLHGDMEQRQRTQVITAFRAGRIRMLVATDVAARGLDVADITHVFNYHIPFDAESYVHRIGRTGRAGKAGFAITLVTPREMRTIQRIAKSVGDVTVREMPTATWVRRKAVQKLRAELAAREIDPAVSALFEDLVGEMSVEEVAMRALTMLVGIDETRGPELIGLSHKEINRLAERAAAAPDRPRRPFRPGGGGRPWGNSGGERREGGPGKGPGGKWAKPAGDRDRKGPGGPGGPGKGPGGKPFRKGPGGGKPGGKSFGKGPRKD